MESGGVVLLPLVLLGVVLFGTVLFGVPVPLLFGIWPCGLEDVGAAVVFGLVALGVSPDDVPFDIDEPLDIELFVDPLFIEPLLVVPLDIEPLLIAPPDAAPVLPGLESCC